MSLLDAIIRYFRPTSQRGYPIGISKPMLNTLQGAAQSTHPNEFICFLTGEPTSNFPRLDMNEGKIITDFYIIPGTKSNPVSAEVKSVNIPITSKILGTLHTHPNGSTQPSSADLDLFGQYPVNIIWGHPYKLDEWKAYTSNGDPLPEFPTYDVHLEPSDF